MHSLKDRGAVRIKCGEVSRLPSVFEGDQRPFTWAIVFREELQWKEISMSRLSETSPKNMENILQSTLVAHGTGSNNL